MCKKEHDLDTSAHPPRCWISPFIDQPHSIVGCKPKGIFQVRAPAQLSHPNLLPDEELGIMILSDTKHHCTPPRYGSAIHANHLWALLVVRRTQDTEIHTRVELLLQTTRSIMNAGGSLKVIPPQVYLLAAFACIRLQRWDDARLALTIANFHKDVTPAQKHDIHAMQNQLPAQAA